jgi:hypothetical protein
MEHKTLLGSLSHGSSLHSWLPSLVTVGGEREYFGQIKRPLQYAKLVGRRAKGCSLFGVAASPRTSSCERPNGKSEPIHWIASKLRISCVFIEGRHHGPHKPSSGQDYLNHLNHMTKTLAVLRSLRQWPA